MKITLDALREAIAGLGDTFTTPQAAAALGVTDDATIACVKSLLFHLERRGELAKVVMKGGRGGRTAHFSRTAAFGTGTPPPPATKAEEAAIPPAVAASEQAALLQQLAMAWDGARVAAGRVHVGTIGHVVLVREEHAAL